MFDDQGAIDERSGQSYIRQARSCPCESCPLAKTCRKNRTTCPAYRRWVLRGSPGDADRTPDKSIDEKVREKPINRKLSGPMPKVHKAKCGICAAEYMSATSRSRYCSKSCRNKSFEQRRRKRR